MTARVRAPELAGAGGWVNTSRPLSLADLRGKVVLLDFWTFCCVNCLHVLDELRPLEEAYADVLVVLGVHSPKFAHETDHAAVVAAVDRYAVRHPVLDDPAMTTWQQYAIRAWPTLVVIDPEGYVVHVASGEGHGESLARVIDDLVEEHAAKGTLRRGEGPYRPPPAAETSLRFPGKVLRLDDGTLLVSDTGHDQLVHLAADGATELRRLDTPQPQGLCRYDGGVVVTDTSGHTLRRVDPHDWSVTTVAGTGAQWRPKDPTSGLATDVPLSTPWDVAVWEGEVVVAMAGTHQLWAYDDTFVRVLAGTQGEGLRDGPAEGAYLAQPSGLAAGADRLWFVDAETSALRWYRRGVVGTAVGTGLFDFGHRDGPASDALFQHPLGLCVLPDGSVAVCDTYNGAIRRYDPATETVTTLATGLAEPSDAVLDGDTLLVVESAAHRLTRVRLPDAARVVDGAAQRTRRPVTEVAPGVVDLEVVFDPPKGRHLDERDGPATRLTVTASPPGLLVEGDGTTTGLARRLVLADGIDEGVLHVAATAASCDEGVEHPACHVTQQDWGIPVRLVPGAASRVALVLRGL